MTKRHIADIGLLLVDDFVNDQSPSCRIDRFEDEDWHQLIGFASSHFILPAIAEPLSRLSADGQPVPDAVAFFEDMQRRNAQRNQELKNVLVKIATALNRLGVTPIALKGAAFLLDARDDAAPWRFMSDIDLLVRADEMMECVGVLRNLGYTCGGDSYDPHSDAHYPPMLSPCGTYSVELHTRLFGCSDFGLDVTDLRREARARPHITCGLLVPSYSDRILHVLLHAQMHNRNYVKKRLVLKDILDLSFLEHARTDGDSLYEDICRLKDPFVAAAAGSLVEAWVMIMGVGPGSEPWPQESYWAKRAIARLHWGRFKSLASIPADILKVEGHRLRTESGHLARRGHQILHPHEIVSAAQSWFYKQRQRYWA